MDEHQQLTKKERKTLKREQREKERLKHQRQKKLKKFLWVSFGIFIIGGVIFGGGWFLFSRTAVSEIEIVSNQGLHRHIDLNIKILGQIKSIPANIGLGVTERSIHTHKEDNIIHLEFSGLVKKDDIRLGQFFEIWEKQFNKNCIFDKCNGSEGKLGMFVNGEPNFEFETYIMEDEDKIEIIFE